MPLSIQSDDTYTVVSVLRTEIVQAREYQSQRVLVVVQIHLIHTGNGLLKNHLSINLFACFHLDAVDKQLDQFRIDLKMHHTIDGIHLMRIEGHHMIYRLHHHHSVRCTGSPIIGKVLIGHQIIFIITGDVINMSILNHYTRDAIAGAYPYLVFPILRNGVNHIIQQTLMTGDHLWQFVRLIAIELQPLTRSDPSPPT